MKKHIFIWIVMAAVLGFGIYGAWKLAQNGSLPSTARPQEAAVAVSLRPDDHLLGPREAKAVLVEYSDFQCPACGAYEPFIQELKKEFGEDLALVYRHFPLPQHLNAEPAARASEAAALQGKFWEMHGIIFENQSEWENAKDAKSIFFGYAGSIGLDAEKFKEDFDSQNVKNKVAGDFKSGQDIYINATPTFFLNGGKIKNPGTYQEFRELVMSALQKNE